VKQIEIDIPVLVELFGYKDPEGSEVILEELLCNILDSNIRLGNQPDALAVSRDCRVDKCCYDRGLFTY
jgi:hypothetical protein